MTDSDGLYDHRITNLLIYIEDFHHLRLNDNSLSDGLLTGIHPDEDPVMLDMDHDALCNSNVLKLHVCTRLQICARYELISNFGDVDIM